MRCSHLRLLALFIAFHVCVAYIFVPVTLSCKCARLRSKYLHPSTYANITIIPPGVACMKTEIIISLKQGTKVCVNPEAKWVQNLVQLIKAKNNSGNK